MSGGLKYIKSHDDDLFVIYAYTLILAVDNAAYYTYTLYVIRN